MQTCKSATSALVLLLVLCQTGSSCARTMESKERKRARSVVSWETSTLEFDARNSLTHAPMAYTAETRRIVTNHIYMYMCISIRLVLQQSLSRELGNVHA